MNPRMTLATAKRVLTQLQRDHRTVAMLLVLPSLFLGLMCWVYSDTPGKFDSIGPRMLGIMPFVVMFIVTSVATLRERRTGTLERLLTTPMNKLDLLLGYGIAFGLVAIVQAGIATGLTMTWFGVDAETKGGFALFLTAATVAVGVPNDSPLGVPAGWAVSAPWVAAGPPNDSPVTIGEGWAATGPLRAAGVPKAVAVGIAVG